MKSLRKKIRPHKSIYFLLGTLLILLPIFSFSANAQGEEFIAEMNVDSPFGNPTFITNGPDDNLWVILHGSAKIGKITTDGFLTEYPIPSSWGAPKQITSGSDGNLWITEYIENKIGKMSLDGSITEYSLPANSNPLGITAGPDGNVWFTEYGSSKVGRITPSGIITEFHLSYGPHGITKGPDGNLWVAIFGSNRIGRITPSGNVTEFSIPTAGSNPEHITAGPDGNLWFTESAANKIGRISPSGNIVEFSIPTPNSMPYRITAGPDGNLWFTEVDANKIGRITPSGGINEFDIPSSNSVPQGISIGSDGNIWFTESAAKKLGRVNLASIPNITPIPTATIVPTSTPTPLPQLTLKDYKQTDPQWGSHRLDNSSNCGTLYGFGCAVSAVADVFYSYGKTLLASVQLNPGTLNNALANNRGFTSCAIIWGNASKLVNLGAPQIVFRKSPSDWQALKLAIDDALASGNLPILGVYTSFGTHFFAVSAKLPDVNGKPDYKIIDPALYPFVANNPGNTGKSLSQTYGGFDKVFETVIYKNGSSAQKSLTIRAHSPVHLLITDPNGNQTGYDEASQTIFENIPESAYGIEPGIAPIDGSAPAMGEVKYFQLIDPSEGDYTIELIGTGQGNYSMDVSIIGIGEGGNSSMQIINGYAQKGTTESYHFEYTGDATEQPVIEKKVTFDVLKSDIKTLYNQKQIKNQLTFKSLKLLAEAAEKTSQANKQPLGNNLAVLALKTFQYELTKLRGKSITEDAYQILYKDAETLINNLQGTTPSPTPGGS